MAVYCGVENESTAGGYSGSRWRQEEEYRGRAAVLPLLARTHTRPSMA